MLHATSLAILATLAASALAAPTPFKAVSHIPQTFKFDVKPRFSASRTPFQELVYTYAKYGWQIIIVDPSNPFASMFGGDDGSSSSIPAPAATTSSAASTETGSADSANTPASAGTPTLTTVTTLVSVVASSTSPATSAATSAANSATTTASGESGKVTASPEKNDSEYLSPVTIGGQALTLDFDTGSADLWSSTWQAYQGATWQISYGDGSAADGTVGFDAVTIGGVTVSKQAVELATGVSGSFVQDTQNDGLVGLGFSTINTVQPQPQKTFFENVMPSLALPVFTANLDKDASGTYTFGAIDSTQYTGDIHYTPVDSSNGFWEFPSSSYTIAGGSPTPCTTCSPAIADTGTSLMLIDDDIVTAYYAQVSGSSLDQSQGGYIYPCSATLPSFGVAIGADYTATIPGSALTFAELGDGTCFGGVQSNQGQGIQIYGDVLLRNFFAVFDGGAKRFGVATKA